MSSTNFPPGIQALGRLFNAIEGAYTSLNEAYAVSGLQSDANTTQIHPEYDPSKTYDIPQSVNFDDFQTNAVGKVETGTSTSSYQSMLATSAQVSAKYGAYSGSVSASWSDTVTATEEEYYATTFDSWSLYTLGFSYHNVDLNTTNPADSSTGLCISPELQSGFDNLVGDKTGSSAIKFFNEYGTHILTGMVVGGQARQDYQGSQSDFTDQEEFQVSVEAKYDSTVGSATFENTTSGANTKSESKVQTNESLDIIGGSTATIDNLTNNPSSDAYSAWNQSIPDYPAFIDYTPDGGTIPVWMLCADSSKQNYLKSVFNQLYGETPLSTYNKVAVDCKDGSIDWIESPGAPTRSWNATNTDEVLVGIGGNIDSDEHLAKMIVVSYSLSRDEYNVYYIGGADEDTKWEAFYMAPPGYVITGFGVARKSDHFEYLYVWYQQLNRQNLDNTYLESDIQSWSGGNPSDSKKIDPKSLPAHGSGWCHGGQSSVADKELQRYFQPANGQQQVITGVELCSSNGNHGFVKMVITQASLRV